MTPPLVYTVDQAAELLQIGRTAAYEAARRGDLPTIRIGRSLRVPRHRLDAMLGVLPAPITAPTAPLQDGQHPRIPTR